MHYKLYYLAYMKLAYTQLMLIHHTFGIHVISLQTMYVYSSDTRQRLSSTLSTCQAILMTARPIMLP